MPIKPFTAGISDHAREQALKKGIDLVPFATLERMRKRGRVKVHKGEGGKKIYEYKSGFYVVSVRAKLVVSVLTLEEFEGGRSGIYAITNYPPVVELPLW